MPTIQIRLVPTADRRWLVASVRTGNCLSESGRFGDGIAMTFETQELARKHVAGLPQTKRTYKMECIR